MKEPNKLWYDLINRFSEQSRCIGRNVGCVIVKDDFQMSEGWNSPPGQLCTSMCERCKSNTPSGEKLEQAICSHAEANAIGHCARHGRSTQGADIYTTVFPCKYCFDLIIISGIKSVYYIHEYKDSNIHKERLKDSIDIYKLQEIYIQDKLHVRAVAV